MTTLGATEFKVSCLEVLERVRRTGESVTITKRGKAIARLVPAATVEKTFPQRSLEGTLEILGDVVAPVVRASAWDATRAVKRRKPRAR